MKHVHSLFVLLGCVVLLPEVVSAQQHQQQASSKREPVYVAPNSLGTKVEGRHTLGAYSLIEFTVPPGTGPVPHRHSREDEAFYILEGELEIRVGKQVFKAEKGAFLFAPRDMPHVFKNVGITPARALVIISPSGFEQFFVERRALLKELKPTDSEYIRRSRSLDEKYGIEFSSDWSFTPRAGD